ncbi:TPA: hypothetical protein DEQ95_00275 [Candidatus Beckwithbacteria bacterium]|nr:MAG: hypothetical protein A2877_00235 [Candidatus Beckwithbacteria bacterium RIFCSPHIGHO2_01_FULL_49_39]HCE99255.1 hypothetical protein [Candidatus Beckwithbacteria bacterium]HCQ92531.1 hypothetical protein [Candidatus Beckwithbacteria bacterium]
MVSVSVMAKVLTDSNFLICWGLFHNSGRFFLSLHRTHWFLVEKPESGYPNPLFEALLKLLPVPPPLPKARQTLKSFSCFLTT